MMRKIYKFIIILPIVILILSTIYSNISIAKSSEKVIDIDVEQKNQDEVIVKLKVSDVNYSIIGVQGIINYDRNKLELKDKKVLKDSMELTGFNNETGKFIIEVNDQNFYDESTFLSKGDGIIEFTFKKNGKVSDSDIYIDNIKVITADYDSIEIEKVQKDKKNNVFFKILILIFILLIIAFIIKKRR